MGKRLLSIALTAFIAILLLVSSPSVATTTSSGNPQPPETQAVPVSKQLVSWEYNQINPTVAYSPPASLFLVAWEDHHWGWGADWDIYGRMVDLEGNPVGNLFGISWENENHRLKPDVAYNSVNNEFLVVYEVEYSVTDHDIYARRVSSTGTLIGGEVPITTATRNETYPVVVYNPDDNQYLVVWLGWEGDIEFGNNDVYGAIIAGDFSTATPLEIRHSPSDYEDSLAATYLSALNQYLVIWPDGVGTYSRLEGQWIYSNGWLGQYEEMLTGFGDNYVPQLAADTQNHEFVYVFENKSYGPPDLLSAYVELWTSVSGFGRPVSWDDTHDQTHLDIAFNSSADDYIIVWEHSFSNTDHDVYAMLFDAYSPNYCCREIGPFAIASASYWEGNPSVASSTGPISLVVWEDYREGATKALDLYMTVIYHGRTNLPLIRK